MCIPDFDGRIISISDDDSENKALQSNLKEADSEAKTPVKEVDNQLYDY